MSAGEMARVLDGTCMGVDPAVLVDDVVVDDRRARTGVFYAAIIGDRNDGHEFAAAAVAGGCAFALTSRPLPGVPCVVVDDTVAALGRLASHVRDELGALVVGVTGSSGKTSTKDLIAQVLRCAGPTVASPGSFNNEVGLPRTIVGAAEGTRYLVLEMGMRGADHIAYLAALVHPSIGVVTNIGHAHIEVLRSQDAIARAKSEIVRTLPADGVAVLNGDDPRVRAMAEHTPARVLLAGESEDCDVRARDVRVDDEVRASFTLVLPDGAADVSLRLLGRHHVGNALLAAAVGHAVGLSAQEIARQLSTAEPASQWRMERVRTAAGVTIINDAYNANPESTAAAVQALAAMPGRRWAVLGEMRELGEHSAPAHAGLGRQVAQARIDRLVCVGDGTRPLLEGARAAGMGEEESTLVPGVQEAIALLRATVQPGDVVLVKASRSIGLERVVAGLTDGAAS